MQDIVRLDYYVGPGWISPGKNDCQDSKASPFMLRYLHVSTNKFHSANTTVNNAKYKRKQSNNHFPTPTLHAQSQFAKSRVFRRIITVSPCHGGGPDLGPHEPPSIPSCSTPAEPVVFECFAEHFDSLLWLVAGLHAGEHADALQHAAYCLGNEVGGVWC